MTGYFLDFNGCFSSKTFDYSNVKKIQVLALEIIFVKEKEVCYFEIGRYLFASYED